jgi:WD40 repeat protein
MTDASTTRKAKVFISYSRDDLAFADQLVTALEAFNFDILIDRKSIPGGAEWEAQIRHMIVESDSVVFVLSPRSAASRLCESEVEEADQHNKRLIPIVCASLEGVSVIAVLRHENEANSAAFSPDGSRIVTASWDMTARIWDAATGKEIAVLRGHDDGVNSAAFSPDGSHIVTASWDKTARIWDTHLETMSVKGLLTEACARLTGKTKLSRDEMRLAGYHDDVPEIDVCQ